MQHHFVLERDGGVVADPEVDPGGCVTGGIGINEVAADDVEPPAAVFVDGPHLLDVLDLHVRANFVLAQHEIRPRLLQVPPLREPDLLVLGVVLESRLLERDG
jgi:hypothetical protein